MVNLLLFSLERTEMMEEDVMSEEETRSEDDETADGVDLDLSLDILGVEHARSVMDAIDIPLFTGRFVMSERLPPITFDDLFTTTPISREQREVINQEVLFTQPVMIGTTAVNTETEATYTVWLMFGFTLLGLMTIMMMNLYLKKKRKRRDNNDFNV